MDDRLIFNSDTSHLRLLAASVRMNVASLSETFARSRTAVSCGVIMLVRARLQCDSGVVDSETEWNWDLSLSSFSSLPSSVPLDSSSTTAVD